MIGRAGVGPFGLDKAKFLDAMQISADSTPFTFEIHLLVAGYRIVQCHPVWVVAQDAKANSRCGRQVFLTGGFRSFVHD